MPSAKSLKPRATAGSARLLTPASREVGLRSTLVGQGHSQLNLGSSLAHDQFKAL